MFDPPEGYFRWQDAPYFALHFKGIGLCEMDFAWHDPAKDVLHLLEVRDYSRADRQDLWFKAGDRQTLDIVHELVQKATDSLLLLSSMWYGLPHAAGLQADVPRVWHVRPEPPRALRVTFVLKLATDAQTAALQPMQDSLRNRLKGRLRLLGLESKVVLVQLLPHTMIETARLPLSVATDENDRRARAGNPQRKGRPGRS